jgi:hypothetical protein
MFTFEEGSSGQQTAQKCSRLRSQGHHRRSRRAGPGKGAPSHPRRLVFWALWIVLHSPRLALRDGKFGEKLAPRPPPIISQSGRLQESVGLHLAIGFSRAIAVFLPVRCITFYEAAKFAIRIATVIDERERVPARTCIPSQEDMGGAVVVSERIATLRGLREVLYALLLAVAGSALARLRESALHRLERRTPGNMTRFAASRFMSTESGKGFGKYRIACFCPDFECAFFDFGRVPIVGIIRPGKRCGH